MPYSTFIRIDYIATSNDRTMKYYSFSTAFRLRVNTNGWIYKKSVCTLCDRLFSFLSHLHANVFGMLFLRKMFQNPCYQTDVQNTRVFSLKRITDPGIGLLEVTLREGVLYAQHFCTHFKNQNTERIVVGWLCKCYTFSSISFNWPIENTQMDKLINISQCEM